MKKIILLILITLTANSNELFNISKSITTPLIYKGEGHMILNNPEGGNPFIYPITMKTIFEPRKDIDKGRHLFITKEEMSFPLINGSTLTQKVKKSIITDSSENIIIIERITNQDGRIEKVYCLPQEEYNKPLKEEMNLGAEDKKRFYKCTDKTIQAGFRYLTRGRYSSGNLITKSKIKVFDSNSSFFINDEKVFNLEKDGTINYILGSSVVGESMVITYRLEKDE